MLPGYVTFLYSQENQKVGSKSKLDYLGMLPGYVTFLYSKKIKKWFEK